MEYIFFYENYDIYKTEQLCANLFKLMEMILISKQLNKTLVVPNFYFTPRNNELINTKKSLEIDRIELINVSNILNLENIKKICNIISITDYFKLKDLKHTLICKPTEEVPFINNKYYTIYGILNIQKKMEINYSSLSILNNSNNTHIKGNIVVHNYNRMGNPVWYKQFEKVYYEIRNSLKFNDYLIEKANNFINSNLKDKLDTVLLVHWRRGDFMTIKADTSDADDYYNKCNKLGGLENLIKNILVRCLENKLETVFLLTNETDENQLFKLSDVLKQFNVEVIVYSNASDNNYLKYVINDICGIIIGSKCKYQLHTHGSYDQMSQYGRWIMEENMKNNFYWVN